MPFYHFEERKPCQQSVIVRLERKESMSKTLPFVNIIWAAHLQTYKLSDSFYLDSHFPRDINLEVLHFILKQCGFFLSKIS